MLCLAVRLKDADAKIWYVNKKSLTGWAKTNLNENHLKLKNLDGLLIQVKERAVKQVEYPKQRIAEELFLKEVVISDVMEQKVNTVNDYLKERGLKLVGVISDGNCFSGAYFKSYVTISRKIPLLEMQENPLVYLRGMIASFYANNNEDTYNTRQRVSEIKMEGEHVTLNEGRLLAKALPIPIRIITVNQDEQGSGISDMLIFTKKGHDDQEWDTLDKSEKPKEGQYITIVDLGGHFVTATPSVQ